MKFSAFASHFSRKRRAFTLAEVLITLGIIGVIAVLTIPAFLAHNKKVMIETRLKKVYSTMNQAILLSIANETWTQPPTNKRNDDEALKEWLNNAVFPYLSNIKIYNAGEYAHPGYNLRNWHGIRFSDGSMMAFHNNMQIFVYYDINGSTGPNKAGNDIFVFFMDYSGSQASGSLGRFYPAGYIWDNGDKYVYNSRDMMKHYCNPENLHVQDENTCALLIMQDGWQVAKDYPVKLK